MSTTPESLNCPSELPILAPGLRWSPDPDDDEDGYKIVAQTPGWYRIDKETISPRVFIGSSLRSTIGIRVGDDGDQEQSDEDIITENIHDNNIEDKDTWIPYQELRGATTGKTLSTDLSISARYSKYAAHMDAHPVGFGFSYPKPQEVFRHMIESTRDFHSDIYGNILESVEKPDYDCLGGLRPEALDVLSSGDYSQEK
ncbi:MAG: hypothetical protein Q9165_006013 [Trypethelium subeluteriae]